MVEENTIKKYEQYLEMLAPYFKKYFEAQAPYIFCKEGCAICCETGVYPFGEVEFDYAMLGYEALTLEQKEEIQAEVKKIKLEKEKSGIKDFMHKCPFLLNKKCSIYNHRGIICRSYGLMYFTEDDKGELAYKMPCCVDDGLNYSNVYDPEKGTITTEKYKKTGIEIEPLSYNVGLKFLLKNSMTEKLELEFTEQKAIIDWFE